MSASGESSVPGTHAESPDPASHARNAYDEPAGESVDEDDNDDIDFEPTTEGSDENEFFDPEEDPEAEFQGQRFQNRANFSYVSEVASFFEKNY